MIELRGVTYCYPGASAPALDDVSVHIIRGKVYGIVGANKAGKSTLCYALTGFIPHFFHGKLDGQLWLAGRDVRIQSLASLAGLTGLVFQNPFNQISGARFSVREEIAFGLENLGVPTREMHSRVEQALITTGLRELADRSPYQLSGGQQQRLAIASMLVMQPDALVLDEPTSQLDPIGTRDVFDVLHRLAEERDTAVVIATHKLEWLATCADEVLLLHQGQVLHKGPPREVLSRRDAAELGVRSTSYTLAARALSEQVKELRSPLPVTLEQALDALR